MQGDLLAGRGVEAKVWQDLANPGAETEIRCRHSPLSVIRRHWREQSKLISVGRMRGGFIMQQT